MIGVASPAYRYQYNGKELQEETGWNDYGWRQYMPEIGRWNGIDQLAEKYLSTSTYAYVANNPVLRFDVDGRWFNEDGTINTSGYTPSYTSGKEYRNSFLGVSGNNGGGGGYTLTGNAAGSMFNYLANGGNINGVSFKNGWAMWSTLDDIDPRMYYDGEIASGDTGGVTLHKAKLYSTSFDWYTPGGRGNWFFGAGAVLAGVKGGLNAERMYVQGIRGGLSGNYVLTGRNLSLFGKMPATTASMPISSVAKWGGIAGKASFAAGVVMDGVGVYNYYNNPNSKNKVHPAKAGLNTTIGAYGLTGAGTIPALLYFGVDAFYPGGWEGYGNDYESIQSENAAIVPGFITAPYGSQKF